MGLRTLIMITSIAATYKSWFRLLAKLGRKGGAQQCENLCVTKTAKRSTRPGTEAWDWICSCVLLQLSVLMHASTDVLLWHWQSQIWQHIGDSMQALATIFLGTFQKNHKHQLLENISHWNPQTLKTATILLPWNPRMTDCVMYMHVCEVYIWGYGLHFLLLGFYPQLLAALLSCECR